MIGIVDDASDIPNPMAIRINTEFAPNNKKLTLKLNSAIKIFIAIGMHINEIINERSITNTDSNRKMNPIPLFDIPIARKMPICFLLEFMEEIVKFAISIAANNPNIMEAVNPIF